MNANRPAKRLADRGCIDNSQLTVSGKLNRQQCSSDEREVSVTSLAIIRRLRSRLTITSFDIE